MKQPKIKYRSLLSCAGSGMLILLLACGNGAFAQTTGEGTSDTAKAKTSEDAATAVLRKTPVKNTFESNLIIDQQTVMVPVKGTLEFDIQHRFGIMNNGYQDFYGLFAPALIRLGMEYVPVKNLQVGVGLCSYDMNLDLNLKYALLKQTEGGMPVSVTYYGNMMIDTRGKNNFITDGDRISYFNQLMVARKITSAFSAQAAISLSHFNNVPGYTDKDGLIQSTVENDQFTFSLMGRYKVSNQMAILVDYDQPLTQNTTNNPHPNLAVGIEITTSSHCFQILAGNGQFIQPQNNALLNQNDLTKGQYLVGFNMTKLWNF